MNDIDWPEDPLARIEAKIDNLRDNHIAHVAEEQKRTSERFSPIEKATAILLDEMQSRKRWSLLSGIVSTGALVYLVLK